MAEFQLFVCGRDRFIPRCTECHSNSVVLCAFELGGSKAGKRCERAVCADHAIAQPDGSFLCRPHHELTQRRASRG